MSLTESGAASPGLAQVAALGGGPERTSLSGGAHGGQILLLALTLTARWEDAGREAEPPTHRPPAEPWGLQR